MRVLSAVRVDLLYHLKSPEHRRKPNVEDPLHLNELDIERQAYREKVSTPSCSKRSKVTGESTAPVPHSSGLGARTTMPSARRATDF